MDNSQVLLVNFDALVEKSLYELLCRHGHKVNIAGSMDEVVNYLDTDIAHVILTDIKSPSDIKTLKAIKENTDNCEIVALASYGDFEAAVDSIKMGAFDYLPRPVKDEKILETIKHAIGCGLQNIKTQKKRKTIFSKKSKTRDDDFYGLVGTGDEAKAIYSLIERISSSKTTVLLQGESGTGKRLIAQAMHKADKKRMNKPFIEISCGALPREIIESELFGHTKGAFTGAISDRKGRFELAHEGTILLDDIDSLPLDLQVKLLRVLQQKEFEKVGDHKTIKVDVRVIATTNQDIKKAVVEKRFREDLYYRINVISIQVPSLRERREDVELLVKHFVNLYSKENQKKIKGVSAEAMEVLISYEWPGNVRELENIIERAIILDIDGAIDTDDLPEIILAGKPSLDIIKNIATSLKDVLLEPEKVHILKVLKEVGWNKKKAALKLGVNRTTLYNKLRKYDIFSSKNQ